MRETGFLQRVLGRAHHGDRLGKDDKAGVDTLRAEVARLSTELAQYRGAYETTVADRDRLKTELAAISKANLVNEAETFGDSASRAMAGLRPLPTVFVVTMPKSGTVYLINVFTKGMGLRYLSSSNNGFPSDSLSMEKMQGIRAGNCYSTAHLSASGTNVQMLKYFLEKFVVHVRDPRQAMWSWYHNVDKLLKEGHRESLIQMSPMVPEPYDAWSPEQRLEWQIRHHLPQLVSWTQEWLEVHAADKDHILLCDYEDFARDLPRYIERVLAFYEIPREEFDLPEIERTIDVHFRSGDPNEWRTQMPSHLIDRTNELVPDALLAQMGWQR